MMNFKTEDKPGNIMLALLFVVTGLLLTLFRMDLFGGCYAWEGQKGPVAKICHIYPAMMKLGTVIPYLKKIQKIYESRDIPVAGISIFTLEISKFCYSKKYRYRLHFNTSFLILLTFFIILMMSAKMTTLGLLKIKIY